MSSDRAFDAWSLREASEALLLVTAALETGLLQSLREELTSEEAGARTALDPRAVAICLAAMEEIGVVERGSRGWRLSPFGLTRFADPASTSYQAADLPLWRSNLRGWLFLDEVLRTGTPLPEERSPEFLSSFYRSLDGKPPARVQRVVEGILTRAPRSRPHVLDVGGGSGVYARAFVDRGCRVTLLDTPETIEHVRQAFDLQRYGALKLVGGDFLAELPGGPYEAVLVADVLHTLSREDAQRLLDRVAGATKGGGVVGVVERLKGRSSGAAFFAITMLLYSAAGDAYEEAEVSAWLTRSGFKDPRTQDLDPAHALVTARRDA
jgi:ubiquinone/menaquinone biosynthesis C-methylase UbiE